MTVGTQHDLSEENSAVSLPVGRQRPPPGVAVLYAVVEPGSALVATSSTVTQVHRR